MSIDHARLRNEYLALGYIVDAPEGRPKASELARKQLERSSLESSSWRAQDSETAVSTTTRNSLEGTKAMVSVRRTHRVEIPGQQPV